MISHRLSYLLEPICPSPPSQKNHSHFKADNFTGYFVALLLLVFPHRQMTHSSPNLGSPCLAPPVDCKYKIRSELASVSDSRGARSPIDSEGDDCHLDYVEANSYLGSDFVDVSCQSKILVYNFGYGLRCSLTDFQWEALC